MSKIDNVIKNLENEGYCLFFGNYMKFNFIPKLRSANGLPGSGVVMGFDVLDGNLFSVDCDCVDYEDIITEEFVKDVVEEYEKAVREFDMQEAAFYSSLGRLHIQEGKEDFKTAFDLKNMANKLQFDSAKEVEWKWGFICIQIMNIC